MIELNEKMKRDIYNSEALLSRKNSANVNSRKLQKNTLTETDYSPLTAHHSLKKSAFTLAEVLITLGIIGVVAAITLPSLIQKYQKKTYIEGLKVGVSIFEQGFKAAMADDGVDDLADTTLWKNCNENSAAYNSTTWKDKCQPELSKYFKGIKFESVADMQALGDSSNIMTNTDTCRKLVGKTNKWYYLNDKSKCRGWKNIAVTLANGMRADAAIGNDHGYFVGAITALDVNGGKGPNTWGRDTFYLMILKDGRVVGSYSKAEAEAYAKYNNKDITSIIENYKTKREAECNNTTTEAGDACSGRVIDEGWVMNY